MPENDNTGLAPKAQTVNNITKTDTGAKKIGLPGLHNRARQAEARTAAKPSPAQMPNRIGLMVDCSGSMGVVDVIAGDSKPKVELMQMAYDAFVGAVNFDDTALACTHFPSSRKDLALTNIYALAYIHSASFSASGGTPMAEAMDKTLEYPISRAIIISDGEAYGCIREAERYKAAEIPIDCVHIGSSGQGEELLSNIARITGGIYLKFTSTEAFVKAFEYLTPAKRHLMLNGSVTARELGATTLQLK